MLFALLLYFLAGLTFVLGLASPVSVGGSGVINMQALAAQGEIFATSRALFICGVIMTAAHAIQSRLGTSQDAKSGDQARGGNAETPPPPAAGFTSEDYDKWERVGLILPLIVVVVVIVVAFVAFRPF